MENRSVRDLMLPLDEYATVSSEETIREALRALDKAQLGITHDRHHHRAILVLDKQREVMGKLSRWAILRSLEPKIFTPGDTTALDAAGLSSEFIGRLEEGIASRFGNLPALCSTASKTKVIEAMVPLDESIDENASLMDAIHQLVTTHVQSMPVTRDKKTVGVLRLSDVFEEVADIIRKEDDNIVPFNNLEM